MALAMAIVICNILMIAYCTIKMMTTKRNTRITNTMIAMMMSDKCFFSESFNEVSTNTTMFILTFRTIFKRYPILLGFIGVISYFVFDIESKNVPFRIKLIRSFPIKQWSVVLRVPVVRFVFSMVVVIAGIQLAIPAKNPCIFCY